MTNEEYKKYIHDMVEQIDDNVILKFIFQYVHKYFIKCKTGI